MAGNFSSLNTSPLFYVIQYDALQREIIETEQDLKRLEEQANQSATAANFESSMVVK